MYFATGRTPFILKGMSSIRSGSSGLSCLLEREDTRSGRQVFHGIGAHHSPALPPSPRRLDHAH